MEKHERVEGRFDKFLNPQVKAVCIERPYRVYIHVCACGLKVSEQPSPNSKNYPH